MTAKNNRIRISLDFINEKKCRKYALQIAKTQRLGCRFNRVSREEFLCDLNALVRTRICDAVLKHPTKGKTIRFLF